MEGGTHKKHGRTTRTSGKWQVAASLVRVRVRFVDFLGWTILYGLGPVVSIVVRSFRNPTMSTGTKNRDGILVLVYRRLRRGMQVWDQ